jgi:flagellar biogenesis protein FliO
MVEITQTQVPAHAQPSPALFFRLAVARLKVCWRSVVERVLSCRAGSRHKALAVRETAALGDRRFVSVIQFERQRFLIGSSPSSVTLLAQLPDESASGEMPSEATRERSAGERSGRERQGN